MKTTQMEAAFERCEGEVSMDGLIRLLNLILRLLKNPKDEEASVKIQELRTQSIDQLLPLIETEVWVSGKIQQLKQEKLHFAIIRAGGYDDFHPTRSTNEPLISLVVVARSF